MKLVLQTAIHILTLVKSDAKTMQFQVPKNCRKNATAKPFCVIRTNVTISKLWNFTFSYVTCFCLCGSRDSSSVYCWAKRWIIGYSSTTTGWELFSSPPCPDRLWSSPSLLSNGYQRLFP